MTDEVKHTNEDNPMPEAKEKKRSRRFRSMLSLLLVALILIAAIAAMVVLVSMREEPRPQPSEITAPLLNACPVVRESLQMLVTGYGTVEPRAEVQVVPQVSGRVDYASPNFINGGFFEAGETLVRIDPSDYALAVEQARAEVASARTQLERELSEADVARREWETLHPDEEPTSELVLRKPQVEEARSALEAAEARLKRARLDLRRTEISMPFAGRVIQSSVDEGQYVTAGQAVGAVYRTDVVEISVPLENRELEWFNLPLHRSGQDGGPGAEGARAAVRTNFAGRPQQWQGQVTRTQGRIDSASRLVHVIVQVRNPFETDPNQSALVPGMFVQVDIYGRRVDSIIRVPRYALHRGREVWVARDDTLDVRPVKVVRMDERYAYITEGLRDGELVITSPLEVVTDGMKIRVNASEEPCAEKADEQR